jgi:hypothetical protein
MYNILFIGRASVFVFVTPCSFSGFFPLLDWIAYLPFGILMSFFHTLQPVHLHP